MRAEVCILAFGVELDLCVVSGFSFGISLTLGWIPNIKNPVEFAGGVRVGLSFGGEIECGPSGCEILIIVGASASACIVRGYALVSLKSWCTFGPFWPAASEQVYPNYAP